MINMFSFSFALVLLIILGVNGQTNNLNTFPSNSVEKIALLGQLHRLIDHENQDSLVSCVRVRPNIKNAYPIDNTKYFVCRDQQRYEIFTCPNGGIFNDREKACIDLCEQKQPCLNQGQCIILSNLTLQCVCRRDWTGEQCEIPLSTCARNPCGPNAECRMLKTIDYSQDYVCICNNQQSYGRNCQQTVPNPCLKNLQQFHPFAFSRRAYINCDGKLIFFQPCNARLYWNQEEKRCDRSLPLLLRAPFMNLKNQNEQKQQILSNIARPIPSQNQILDNSVQTNQRFTPQSPQWQRFQTIENQQSLTNTFVETTTTVPKIFHLKGFLTQNSGQQNTQWQNNPNNQIQSSGDLKTPSMNNQPWLQGQNQQILTATTSPQMQMPFQQNNQFGFNQQQQQQNIPVQQQFQTQNDQSADMMTEFSRQNFVLQSRPDQFSASSIETTTVANKDVQPGLFEHTLRGWQSNQQGSSNQIDQQNPPNSIPTFHLGSWKT